VVKWYREKGGGGREMETVMEGEIKGRVKEETEGVRERTERCLCDICVSDEMVRQK
jgi:hypothetical protein